MPDIDRSSRLPAWKQIAAHLRAGIADGTYPPGTPLPSTTRLVQDYGVARLTALKALRRMEAEGLVEMEPGMGFYVTGPAEISDSDASVTHERETAPPPEWGKGL